MAKGEKAPGESPHTHDLYYLTLGFKQVFKAAERRQKCLTISSFLRGGRDLAAFWPACVCLSHRCYVKLGDTGRRYATLLALTCTCSTLVLCPLPLSLDTAAIHALFPGRASIFVPLKLWTDTKCMFYRAAQHYNPPPPSRCNTSRRWGHRLSHRPVWSNI